MKPRNLEHEMRIRAYLFSGCFERHKAICKNLNVRAIEDRGADYKKGFNLLMEYFDSLPDEQKPEIDKQLKQFGL